MSDTVVKPMAQKDRAELRRILKARFQLLQQQLRQRQMEVSNSIEEKLRFEHEAAIKKAQKKSAALEKKVAKLAEEASEIVTEMRDNGIQPGEGNRYGRDRLFTYEVTMEWSPVDLEKKVQAAYQKITEQAGLHQIDLNLKQLELEEQLAISALGSDEAKEFLAKIPDIDNLLPMNGNVTAALATGEVIDA